MLWLQGIEKLGGTALEVFFMLMLCRLWEGIVLKDNRGEDLVYNTNFQITEASAEQWHGS